MKTITKQAAYDKAVGNVLATLRIEQLKPSKSVERRLNDCVEGKDTTQQVLEQVIQHHVALRRV
ncbi:antitoxin VbhA family protein [Chitinimonas koreensis]|uniref:antitoxin VbhA family protein n=1 Tax=Chitinimonas koreensis TaxID=356302 RepID=UPI00040C3178|nr:antitoxin VbhA family protein [Chitinimonas koreensis]QNM95766.1 antitoxin VbhA family protein [Chitinimonas koreensis]